MFSLLRNIVVHILTGWAFLFVIFVLGIIFFFFYEGAPFSWYFFAIFAIFIISNNIDFYIVSKYKDIVDRKNNSIPLVMSHAFLSSIRVVCISIFPILLFQISVKFINELDFDATAIRLESWIIHLDRFFDVIQAKKYLGYTLLTILIIGVFAKGFSSILVSYAFRGITVIGFLLFIASFSFFTVVAFDESEKVWRAEKRAKIDKYEAKVLRNISESLVLQSMLSSDDMQRELLKLTSAILATSVTYELMPASIRRAIYSNISMLTFSVNYKGITNLEENYTRIYYPDGLYDPYLVVKYNDELLDVAYSNRDKHWDSERSLRELMKNMFSEMAPSVPDDLRKIAVNTLISVVTDISMVLLERSQAPTRALLLHAYLETTEPIKDRVKLESFDKQIIELVRSIDDVDLEGINNFVIEKHLNQPKGEYSWSELFEKIRRSALRAL